MVRFSYVSLELIAALIKSVCNKGIMVSTHFHLKNRLKRVEDFTVVQLLTSSRLDRITERYKIFISAMSNTYTSAVLVIILLFSLLNTPVSVGKPLLGSQEEESPNFQINDRDKIMPLMKYL